MKLRLAEPVALEVSGSGQRGDNRMRLKVKRAFSRDGVDVNEGDFAGRTSQHASANHLGGRMTRYWLHTLRAVQEHTGAIVNEAAEIDVTDLVDGGQIEVI